MAEFKEGVTKEMIECAKGYADYIMEQIKSPDATVLLEQRVDFSPWVPHGFGTCDCTILQGKEADIIDYKYGQGVPVEAENNPQMMLYALGVVNDFAIAYDIENVNMHIYQPRINNISTSSIAVKDLMIWASTLVKPVAQMAAKGEGVYNAGAHCRFCPHAGRCRELNRSCTEFVNTHGMKVGVPVLADWEIADVLQMEPIISLWLRRVKDQALTSLLDGKEIPGFKCVEGKMGNRKWTDEVKVAETLRDAGFDLNDITETKLLSPAAMDKSIGKKKVAELLEELIDRSPGSPIIAPETDSRPAYDRKAEIMGDFE